MLLLVYSYFWQLAADSELSVKNGAELLDRLVKDIVSESAASYVSVLRSQSKESDEGESKEAQILPADPPTAFSLARFIPLLKERITVMNPFTRMFLVSWITLLDSIPDLELVTYLPEFLGGLFKFLSDSNPDVHTATQVALDKFLAEIKKIARLKRGIAESKRSQVGEGAKRSDSTARSDISPGSAPSSASGRRSPRKNKEPEAGSDESGDDHTESSTIGDDTSTSADGEEDWIPGQDVRVDHTKILDILVTFLGGSSGRRTTLYG
jgi:vacuole morphology and inheritance protein 14